MRSLKDIFTSSFGPKDIQKELFDKIVSNRQVFEDAVKRALWHCKATGKDIPEANASLIETARKGFDELEAKVRDGVYDDAGNVEDQAQYLSRLRAYILPESELAGEAAQIIHDLKLWGVPDKAIADIQGMVDRNIQEDNRYYKVETARSSLNKVYFEYDWWEWNIKDFIESVYYKQAPMFAAAFLLFFGLAFWFVFYTGHLIIGLCFVAASGGCLSVLTKLPAPNMYDVSARYDLRAVVRILAGAAAAIMGYGLLATGIFNIPTSFDGAKETLPMLIEQCSMPAYAGRQAKADMDAVKPTGKQAVTKGEKVKDAAGLKPVVKDQEKDTAKGAANGGAADSSCAKGCTTRSLSIIFAVILAFGFSERALSSFESSIFSKSSDSGGKVSGK